MAITFGVYLHKNMANNKVYVGITCQKPIERRWKNGNGYKKSPLFYNAIEKYGWDNFQHTILFEGLTKKEAEEKEIELISEYQSNNRKYGYNIQNGGGVASLTEITKNKIRNINIGKKVSNETKEKMRLSHLGKQKCLGYKHTDEVKEKHKKLMSGSKNPRAKAIIQYDLEGNYIKTYSTMKEALIELNINSSCHISDCCRGKRNKCYGYKWKYCEEV